MAPLRIGTLLVGSAVQFLDTAVIDILAMHDKDYLTSIHIPEALIAQGYDMEFLYIAEQGSGLFTLTGGLSVNITHGLQNAGQLDYLLVPGPEPRYQATAAEKAFIKEQLPGLKALFGICTGTFVLAQAGVLDGVIATGPRGFLPMLKETAPKAKWTEKRWEEDGKIWTSGGVTNGNDAISAFVRKTYAPELVNLVLSGADVGERGQLYPDQAQD
ncbi:uncharacterized protein PHACADRAFT_249334 [Phanerochaete carnosa HHB-10118-sp]|uniref:DJ-1/PfpI domain-containing protein n=1 Tax=Phanerochaete carnosa (strain HHB-10118-sp) TaxID=650164 RepID=K5WJ11_PHACS|nr:uncharacterized protein PHACADRAFT_249334 [Phanerochaete carnosa HHB-10118-sp]EKM59109.1 hypothetical protein PHACADRAFT_249334 [Phanerochaete carnosa HHB-10118-sp]